jgi:hypothetical protein
MRKVFFNDQLIAKIVEQNNSFELHYVEDNIDIGGDICESLSECFDTLIDYYNFYDSRTNNVFVCEDNNSNYVIFENHESTNNLNIVYEMYF